MTIVRFAAVLLCGLFFAGASPRPAFDRSEWSVWADLNRDCRDTRQEVLIRDSRDPVIFRDPNRPCDVAYGQWVDPYTGDTFRDPGKLDVDHVLSLNEAHRAGGWAWSRERKREYANWTYNLLTVSASANRAKGAKGPHEWRPKRQEFWCTYAERRSAARVAWRLASPSKAEAEATKQMLETCDHAVQKALPEAPGQ